jgi:hypothetical protein
MVDLDAAIGFVVAHGDDVERARLAHLRTGAAPERDLLALVEAGQIDGTGWPGRQGGEVASIDATCFRFAELDDLGALGRPAARQALDWLVAIQRPDGTWEESEALVGEAPAWARPGDQEARLYLTANVAFWLSAAGLTARAGGPLDARVGGAYAGVIADRLRDDGSWPSFLATGWLGPRPCSDSGGSGRRRRCRRCSANGCRTCRPPSWRGWPARCAGWMWATTTGCSGRRGSGSRSSRAPTAAGPATTATRSPSTPSSPQSAPAVSSSTPGATVLSRWR